LIGKLVEKSGRALFCNIILGWFGGIVEDHEILNHCSRPVGRNTKVTPPNSNPEELLLPPNCPVFYSASQVQFMPLRNFRNIYFKNFAAVSLRTNDHSMPSLFWTAF
jgi:hypothetical protein